MTRLPPHARALLDLLSGRAVRLDGPQWRSLLEFADRTQCTLFLRGTPALPDWFAEEIESRLARNVQRRQRLLAAYRETSGALLSRGIEFVLLKSFTHENGFGIDGIQRVQYDLDFLLPSSDLPAAKAALLEIGYAPHGTSDLSALHGRPLIKPGGGPWRGDYYDPDLPIPVELHTALWHTESDRVAAPGVESFWERRTTIDACGRTIPALAEPDRVAFAALHLLRHILHNNVRLSHAFELARLLKTRADLSVCDDPRLRTLQAIAFRFAALWFACPLPDAVERHWKQIDPGIHSWFDRFAFSPVVTLLEPNKDIVWLHAALVPGWRDRLAVLTKRLLPLHAPDRSEAAGSSYRSHVLRRALHHGRALASTLWNGARWRWAASSTASDTSDWKRPNV